MRKDVETRRTLRTHDNMHSEVQLRLELEAGQSKLVCVRSTSLVRCEHFPTSSLNSFALPLCKPQSRSVQQAEECVGMVQAPVNLCQVATVRMLYTNLLREFPLQPFQNYGRVRAFEPTPWTSSRQWKNATISQACTQGKMQQRNPHG